MGWEAGSSSVSLTCVCPLESLCVMACVFSTSPLPAPPQKLDAQGPKLRGLS